MPMKNDCHISTEYYDCRNEWTYDISFIWVANPGEDFYDISFPNQEYDYEYNGRLLEVRVTNPEYWPISMIGEQRQDIFRYVCG